MAAQNVNIHTTIRCALSNVRAIQEGSWTCKRRHHAYFTPSQITSHDRAEYIGVPPCLCTGDQCILVACDCLSKYTEINGIPSLPAVYVLDFVQWRFQWRTELPTKKKYQIPEPRFQAAPCMDFAKRQAFLSHSRQPTIRRLMAEQNAKKHSALTDSSVCFQRS